MTQKEQIKKLNKDWKELKQKLKNKTTEIDALREAFKRKQEIITSLNEEAVAWEKEKEKLIAIRDKQHTYIQDLLGREHDLGAENHELKEAIINLIKRLK